MSEQNFLPSTYVCFFSQAEDGIRDGHVTGVQTCALPIWKGGSHTMVAPGRKTIGSPRSNTKFRKADRSDARSTNRSACERCEDIWFYRRGNTMVDRKSTRLNSSHVAISYAVFCLKKKKKN